MSNNPTSKSDNEQKVKWTETVIPDNFIKCDHYFEFVGQECKCQKCNLGLMGVYSLKNGKPVL